MKTAERQHLKTNELANTVAHVRQTLQRDAPQLGRILLVVALVAVLVLGFFGWRQYRSSQADAALADALATDNALIVPPAPPAVPGQPAPAAPPAGSFATEEARSAAALQKLTAVADAYASTDAGRLARYRAAAIYAEQGKLQDAEREFKYLSERAGSSLYGRMARLGLADLQVRQGQYDAAIESLRELSTRSGGDLPLDGVLMQLGRAQALAGKRADAVQTYTRVVEEFPQSIYAGEARRELDRLKAGA